MNNRWILYCAVLAGSASAESNWWNQFGDSGIDSLVEIGLKQNKSVVASKERLNQTEEQAKLYRSQVLPSIYGNGRVGRSDLNGSTIPTKADYMSTGAVSLDARYVVSSLGKEAQAYRSANFLAKSKEEEHRQIELAQSIKITKLALDASFAKTQIHILEEQKKSSDQLLELVKLRYERGERTGLAFLQQKQQAATASASLAPAKLQYQSIVNQLAATTSLSVDQIEPMIPDSLPELAPAQGFSVENRPDIAAAEYREKSAKAAFSKAKLTTLPTVAITGSAGYDYADPGTAEWEKMWSVGASVQVPLFTGGATAAGYREGRAGYYAASAALDQNRVDAQAELDNAIAEEESYRIQCESYTIQYDASKAVYEESLRQYRNGLVEYLEVLNAVSSLQRTEITLLQSKRNLISARLNTISASGGSVQSNLKGN